VSPSSHPPPAELDADVIERAVVGGSPEALIRVYRHYGGRVRHAIARAALAAGHSHDIADLTQDVWARLLHDDRRLLRYYDPGRGEGGCPFGPFLCHIARQQAWQVLHREHRKVLGEGVVGGIDELVDEGALELTARLVQSDLFRKLLREVDERLGEHDRVLLREHHVYGRTLRSVAQELGVSEAALYKRNERLKRKLAKVAERLVAESRSSGAGVATGVVVLVLLHGWGGVVRGHHMGPVVADPENRAHGSPARGSCMP
jgi:RNA polymerase sigma factor (sigma-70 family)